MKRTNLRIERERHRREDNKIFILKAAEKVIAQKGYSSATMDDIAEEAQFSKATLYRYFPSKGELFFEIIVSSLDEMSQKMRNIQEKRMRSDRKLTETIRLVLKHFEEKENIARIFFMDKFLMEKLLIFMIGEQDLVSDTERRYIKKIKAKRKEVFNSLCEIITSGVDGGEFRRLQAEETVIALESMLYGFYYGRYWRDKRFSLEKGTDLIYNHFFHGIKKGRK